MSTQNGLHPTPDLSEEQAPPHVEPPQQSRASMTHAAFELLSELRRRSPSLTNGNGPKNIQIQRGRNTLYQDGYNDQAPTNDLSLADIDYVQYALQQSPGQRIGGPGESLNITVSGQSLFRSENGIVTHNGMVTRTQEQAAPTHPPLANGPYFAIPTPAPVVVQGPMTLERRDNPPSFLERIDAASDLSMPTVNTEKWMKRSWSERVQQKVETFFRSIRKNRTADTAIDLLQKYGQRQGQEYVYEAERYRLRGVGRYVLVEDRRGNGLITIKTRWLGRPVVKGYNLSSEQEEQFLKVRAQMPQGFATDPLIRSYQMGGLAPQGDVRLAEDLKAFSVSDVARDLLNASGVQPINGKRVLDGQHYQVVEEADNLVIYAKGRGEIFGQRGGTIASKLTTADTKYFIFINKELANLGKQRQASALQSSLRSLRMT